MNDNHIRHWANKCGLNIYTAEKYPKLKPELLEALTKFAEYSANYERDCCAKICYRQSNYEGANDIWKNCAAYLTDKIRARKK
jgi:hypothetical protein